MSVFDHLPLYHTHLRGTSSILLGPTELSTVYYGICLSCRPGVAAASLNANWGPEWMACIPGGIFCRPLPVILGTLSAYLCVFKFSHIHLPLRNVKQASGCPILLSSPPYQSTFEPLSPRSCQNRKFALPDKADTLQWAHYCSCGQ